MVVAVCVSRKVRPPRKPRVSAFDGLHALAVPELLEHSFNRHLPLSVFPFPVPGCSNSPGLSEKLR
eukprot:3860768-Rhodomonas_salina.1